jgi:hypothetical protein
MPKAPHTRYAFRNMAPLEIAPAQESNSTAPALLIAFLALAAVAGAIFYFNPHKVAELRVTGTDLYAPHTTFAAPEGAAIGNGTHVLGAPSDASEDNLYVIAKVSLTDKLRLPLFISGATAQVTLADGSRLESNLLSSTDLKRLEVIFPEITQRASAPISDGDEINSGETRTGTVVLPFPGQTAAAWQGKKGASLTISLRNQEPQTTALP